MRYAWHGGTMFSRFSRLTYVGRRKARQIDGQTYDDDTCRATIASRGKNRILISAVLIKCHFIVNVVKLTRVLMTPAVHS